MLSMMDNNTTFLPWLSGLFEAGSSGKVQRKTYARHLTVSIWHPDSDVTQSIVDTLGFGTLVKRYNSAKAEFIGRDAERLCALIAPFLRTSFEKEQIRKYVPQVAHLLEQRRELEQLLTS